MKTWDPLESSKEYMLCVYVGFNLPMGKQTMLFVLWATGFLIQISKRHFLSIWSH
jgi:hypothetical protein